MTDDDVIAIVRLLVQIRAENLALLKCLQKDSAIPANFLRQQVAIQTQSLYQIPAIAQALSRNDPSNLPTLLSTLSVAQPV